MTETSTTFGSWKDRLTHIMAEAQILVGGIFVSLAIGIIWFKPEIPGVPPIVVGWSAAILLLGPPVFGFFVWLINLVRVSSMISVYHVDAQADELKKYYVEKEVWKQKDVNGPDPYPVNGAAGWAVQSFDWDEELEQLRVSGVWLSEVEDTKLLSDKKHMRSIYGKLTESHIALKIFRDSVSEFGADIQEKLINSMAESRERGKMMDKSAVKDVFGEFEDEIEGRGSDDLPNLEADEQAMPEQPDPAPDLEATAEQAATATDGGSEQ